jgi:hypothetical protein
MKKTIRNIGKVYSSDSIEDKYATRVTRKFLDELTIEFARVSNKLIGPANFLEYPPFAYRERQIHTILSPALFNTTDFFILEAPANREKSKISDEDDSHGWSDYVCNYNGFCYIIEVKHWPLAYKTLTPDQHMKNLWRNAIDQNTISEFDAKWYSKRSKGAYRLALLVSPIYQSSSNQFADFTNDKDYLISKLFDQFNIHLKKKPDYLSLWALHDKLCEPYHADDITHFYSGVAFAAKLSPLKVY